MKKSDISLRRNIQHQKDVGYNLMDKYLGALAGLEDTPRDRMNITELEKLARSATPGEWGDKPLRDDDGISYATYIAAANPATMLKLIDVIRAQHEALEYAAQQVPELRGVPGYAAALAKAAELGVK